MLYCRKDSHREFPYALLRCKDIISLCFTAVKIVTGNFRMLFCQEQEILEQIFCFLGVLLSSFKKCERFYKLMSKKFHFLPYKKVR